MNERLPRWRVLSLWMNAVSASFGVSLGAAHESPAEIRVTPSPAPSIEFRQCFKLLSPRAEEAEEAVRWIRDHWSNAFVAPLLELMPWAPGRGERLARLIETGTGISPIPKDTAVWQWLWNTNVGALSGYAQFKADLYAGIDSRFRGYFEGNRKTNIRLDEVRWGGVRRDGIPPLRAPKMIRADEAGYLAGTNIVFGLEIRGEARAYPQRILAWHEMATDVIAGESVCLVYCTLCGAAIPYRTTFAGTNHHLGTSGFLYRSNKLMYDAATESLWNTLTGEPVVGPLAGQGIRLQALPVVTTTWEAWKRRHPHTRVLSPDTGHRRDYGEGVAYADYFATDELMFPVPTMDSSRSNKIEVLVIRANDVSPPVLTREFLAARPVHHLEVPGRRWVVLTDPSGANRVYEAGKNLFIRWDNARSVVDEKGVAWTVEEDGLRGNEGERLSRVSAHRAFWFGWRAMHGGAKIQE